MKKLTLQQICMQFNKSEYTYNPEKRQFSKAKTICTYPENCIIEEYDDCWVMLSEPKEIIGEIVRENTLNLKSSFSHHIANVVTIDVLYNKLGYKTELFHSKSCTMEAYLYNDKPAIKTRFVLYNIIIK